MIKDSIKECLNHDHNWESVGYCKWGRYNIDVETFLCPNCGCIRIIKSSDNRKINQETIVPQFIKDNL